ncbi:hypothetical protein JM78_27375 [Burkholderia pyrrocinia]|nr:hypothetical protein JM78_27375 [Burkholderia pyrrocinia]
MHVDRRSVKDARDHCREEAARSEILWSLFFEDRHFWEPRNLTVDFGLGSGGRQILIIVQLKPWFRYAFSVPFFPSVLNLAIVRIIHQDEAGSVVCIVFASELGEQVEQPCGSTRFLFEDVGA